MVEWAQCDNCDQWWHAECACITAEDCVRLTFYDISFTCAICCLKGSPWVLKNHFGVEQKGKITGNSTIPIIRTDSDCDKKEAHQQPQSKDIKFCNSGKKSVKKSIKKEDSVDLSNSADSVCDQKQKPNSKHIIVVDNIKEAQHFKSSKNIQEKLIQHPQFKGVNFAYSLPRGGVAIHFNSDKEAEEVLSNWPATVFSDTENPHKIESKALSVTGFVKNIDTRVTDNQLRGFLESKECRVKEVKKVFHRYSGKPMPIRKIYFQSVSDLDKAIKLEYIFKLNGKQAYCEKEKGFRVVRCFSCHRFNHISANCPNRSNCENCSSEDHTFTGDCFQQSKCINCGGKHRSSSNSCPKYLEIIQRVQKNQML